MITEEPAAESYETNCHNCGKLYNALDAVWCNCLVTERTFVCPSCLVCFCKAPSSFKQVFWTSAPQSLWDRKVEEHKSSDFTSKANPEPSQVTRPLILVVDDEKHIQKMATHAIESLGYSIIIGQNGVEGLELVRKYKPDLVLTDAMMPKMDGREMCRQIKMDSEISETKVVIMTSLYTQSKYKTEAYKNFRVDDYLSKPIDINQLRTLLQKHLG